VVPSRHCGPGARPRIERAVIVCELGLSQKKPHGLYRNHKQRHGDNGQSDGARYDKQKLQTGSYPHPLDNPQIGRKWQLR
jgi:hypothetical protein